MAEVKGKVSVHRLPHLRDQGLQEWDGDLGGDVDVAFIEEVSNTLVGEKILDIVENLYVSTSSGLIQQELLQTIHGASLP